MRYKDLYDIRQLAILQSKNFDNHWSESARRALLFLFLDKWVKKNSEEAVVEKLVTALSVSGFLDVKLRVEKLLEMNLQLNKTLCLEIYGQKFLYNCTFRVGPLLNETKCNLV